MNRHTRIFYLQNGKLQVLEFTNLYLHSQVAHELVELETSFMTYIQDHEHPEKWKLVSSLDETDAIRLQSFVGQVPMMYAKFKGEKL